MISHCRAPFRARWICTIRPSLVSDKTKRDQRLLRITEYTARPVLSWYPQNQRMAFQDQDLGRQTQMSSGRMGQYHTSAAAQGYLVSRPSHRACWVFGLWSEGLQAPHNAPWSEATFRRECRPSSLGLPPFYEPSVPCQ